MLVGRGSCSAALDFWWAAVRSHPLVEEIERAVTRHRPSLPPGVQQAVASDGLIVCFSLNRSLERMLIARRS
jgi:hypothetical protein